MGFSGTDVKHALGFYADVVDSNAKKFDNSRSGTEVNLKTNKLAQSNRVGSMISASQIST